MLWESLYLTRKEVDGVLGHEGHPINSDKANHRFDVALKDSQWKCVRGFHG